MYPVLGLWGVLSMGFFPEYPFNDDDTDIY